MNFRTIKDKSKDLLLKTTPKAIHTAIIYVVIITVLGVLASQLLYGNITESDIEKYMEYVQEGNLDYLEPLLEKMMPSRIAYILNIVIYLVLSIMAAGFIIFLLNVIRAASPCRGNLLDGFGMAGRVVLLYILEAIYIFLWSLLFIIPGIIAAYRYRQAIYILIDNPDMGPNACITASKKMMKGHKWELFCLDLSFIIWLILESIPYLGYFVRLWATPYIGMTRALYYENLKAIPVIEETGAYGYTGPESNNSDTWYDNTQNR